MSDKVVKAYGLTETEMQSTIALLRAKLTIATNLMVEAAHQVSVEFPNVGNALKEAARDYCNPNFECVVGQVRSRRDDE